MSPEPGSGGVELVVQGGDTGFAAKHVGPCGGALTKCRGYTPRAQGRVEAGGFNRGGTRLWNLRLRRTTGRPIIRCPSVGGGVFWWVLAISAILLVAAAVVASAQVDSNSPDWQCRSLHSTSGGNDSQGRQRQIHLVECTRVEAPPVPEQHIWNFPTPVNEDTVCHDTVIRSTTNIRQYGGGGYSSEAACNRALGRAKRAVPTTTIPERTDNEQSAIDARERTDTPDGTLSAAASGRPAGLGDWKGPRYVNSRTCLDDNPGHSCGWYASHHGWYAMEN